MSEVHSSKRKSEETDLRSWKQTHTALRDILINPVFIFITGATVCDALLIGGIAAFLPKFIQLQFGLTATVAGFYSGDFVFLDFLSTVIETMTVFPNNIMFTGAITVPGAAGGNLLGGIISKVLKLRVPGMLRYCMLLTFMAALLSVSGLIHCDTPLTIGVNHPYPLDR